MPSLPFTIRFGFNGDYKMWPSHGWSDDKNDRDYTWTDGHVAKLHLVLEYAKSDRLLQIDVFPLKSGGIVQELFFYLNGDFVSFWRVKDAGVISTRVEAGFFVAGDNLFTFVVPKALCPRDEGFGDDQRTLGLAFFSLTLSES